MESQEQGREQQIEKTKEVLGMLLEQVEDINSLFLVASVGKVSINMLTGSFFQNVDAVLNLKKQCPDAFHLFSDVWKESMDVDLPNKKSIIEHLKDYCDTPLKFTKIKHQVIESFMEAEVPLPPSISQAVNVDELALSVEDNKGIFNMMLSALKNRD